MRHHLKYFFPVALLLIFADISAQIEVSKSLELSGNTGNKKVQGLVLPQASNDAANAEYVLKNIAHFVTATGTSNYSVTVTPALNAYVPGLSLIFIVPASNTGTVTLNVSNLGAKPLYRDHNKPLGNGELTQNHIVHVVYDGSAFHVVSPLITPCPQGYITVNDNYCIEQNERSASNFFDAIIDCNDDGARLCTWGEWYFACTQTTSLGLNDMVNNYEWVDDAADEDFFARIVGAAGSCSQIAAVSGVTNNYWHRCCFSR